MQVYDARILRGAAIPTAVVGVLLIVLGGVLAGAKGLVGALLGVLLVGIFFSVGLIIIGRVSRGNPLLVMNVAMLTYLIKIIVLVVIMVALRDTTVFDTKAFAWSILVSTLVWISAEVRAFSQLKIPYVEPDEWRNGER